MALTHELCPQGPGHQPALYERWAIRGGRYRSHDTIEYLPACYGCTWKGKVMRSENRAVEAAHDHAFGRRWRTLPTVPRVRPEDPAEKRDQVLKLIARLYPQGWAERHGPVRTMRGHDYATRNVPGHAPTGGYDMAAGVEKTPAPGTRTGEAEQMQLGGL